MGNDVAAAIPGARGSRREVGADELTEGLLLVRASAIKVVRFQLAMERRDRRVALEAVDDLVLLDRRIEDFLNAIPGIAESRSALDRELEQQRQALVREKFTLAAGMSGRIAMGEAANGRSADRAGDVPAVALPSVEEEFVLSDLHAVEDERRRKGVSSRLFAAALMLALLVAGLVALALLRPDLIGRLPFLEGVS